MESVRKRYLTVRQKRVINDLIACEKEEMEVLAKHGLRLGTYHKWLRDELYVREMKQRIESVRQQEEFFMALSGFKAAKTLVTLATKGEGETARKACVDVLFYGSKRKSVDVEDDVSVGIRMDDATAGKVLSVLAERGRG